VDRKRGDADHLLARVYIYRLRSILRRRWSDYLALTLLVAVPGGLAMGSVVVGRRTQSSFAAFLRRDNASTLTISTYGTSSAIGFGAGSPSPSVVAIETGLPIAFRSGERDPRGGSEALQPAWTLGSSQR
jgi:hypothetical protein